MQGSIPNKNSAEQMGKRPKGQPGHAISATTRRTAHGYAKLGYGVVAVARNGKGAFEKRWPAIAKATLTDPAAVDAMFKRNPGMNIGITPPVGCYILDVDPRNGGAESLEKLLDGATMPRTPTQRSGGGGLHYILKGEPPQLNKATYPGLDIKKHGKGYVVAYPSIHPSGNPYEWETQPNKAKPASAPKQLYGARTDPPSENKPLPDTPLTKIQEALKHVNADDYHRWIGVGQALRNAYGDDGEDAWVHWSKSNSNKWQEKDAEKWETFDRNRDRPLITIRSIMAIARHNGYRPLATEFTETLWATGDMTGETDAKSEPIEWAFEPSIPCGKVTLLAGAGGSSKSFLALTLAMQLAIGQAFGPFEPDMKGKTLVLVSEEDKLDIRRRWQAIFEARMYTDEQAKQIEKNVSVVSVRGMDWRLMYHDAAGDLQETDRVDYLIAEVKIHRNIRLLVLDPMVFFSGVNENDNMEASRLMFTLDRIASETGAAVLVSHHVSKVGQATSIGDLTQAVVRGASALVDNARSVLLLTRMPHAEAAMYNIAEADATRHIVCQHVKSNHGAHMQDTFFAVGAGGAIRHAPEVKKEHQSPTQANKAIEAHTTVRRVFEAYANEPEATQGEIADRVGRTRTTVNKIVQELEKDKCLKRRVRVGETDAFYPTAKGKKRFPQEEIQDDITELF